MTSTFLPNGLPFHAFTRCIKTIRLRQHGSSIRTLICHITYTTTFKTLHISISSHFLFGLWQFNGTPEKPRLSVFCSEKQLYATLIDDQNKKCLFYGSTLQKSIRGDPPCNTIEAAERVGEQLVQTCVDLNIDEISTYDRNGFARGERMQAFEIAISRHGFLFK
uniref:50S ribosomal protein L18, chloroplast n=1 Tax=Solanum tuberosum TaxID=4113 RepID=M1BKQ0_SOLTU